jgi:TPR repeat protein
VCAEAYHNLGNFYAQGMGVDTDEENAKHYYELAAIGGNVLARNNLGCMEGQTGNIHRAMKHFLISARLTLDTIKSGFRSGIVTKDEYANALRSYQKSQDEMKSEARDIAANSQWMMGN